MKSNRRDFLKLAGTTAAMILSGDALADNESPFGFKSLEKGYNNQMLAEGKCGEGKCGGQNQPKVSEGKCGEGKCGGKTKAPKTPEGKCGEGKCGGKTKAPKTPEGKCGEGKCGGRH